MLTYLTITIVTNDMKELIETTYLDEQWRRLKSSLTSYLKGGKQEELHIFRVQVKKIRAFLILSDSTTCAALQRRFKPVKKIFRDAGDIRNAFLNLKTYRDEPNIHKRSRKSLRRQMKKAVRHFKAAGVANKMRLKEMWRQIRKRIRPIEKAPASLFYKQQLQVVAGMLAMHGSENELHNCRKILKVLIYNYAWAAGLLDVTLNVEYLSKVEDAIGKWHDHISASRQMVKSGRKVQYDDTSLRDQITDISRHFYANATLAGNSEAWVTTSLQSDFILN